MYFVLLVTSYQVYLVDDTLVSYEVLSFHV